MTAADLLTLAPFLAVATTAVAVLLAAALRGPVDPTAGPEAPDGPRSGGGFPLTAAGLVAALATLPVASAASPRTVGALLVVDGLTVLYAGLLLGSGLAVVAFARGYLARLEDQRDELYALLLFAVLGAMVLAASRHFATLLLGLELLSVALYALVGYLRLDRKGLEAAVKYLVLAAAASSFLLFGAALLYARLGTLVLPEMAARLASAPASPVVLLGLALVVVGVGFKLALVPFHMWTPDVYQGAPAPVTALVASVSKAGMVALLLRLATGVEGFAAGPVGGVLAVVAAASIVAGNLLALLQDDVKRLLAYSSIAHLGYLLVAVVAGGERAAPAATFYLAAYLVTILGAFGVVSAFSEPGNEAGDLARYRGLLWRRPGYAVAFAAMLFSLAGIPLTAGFLGKLHVVVAGAGAERWGLLLVLAAGSAIGLYYYLRVVVVMFGSAAADGEDDDIGDVIRHPATTTRPATAAALAVLTALLLWLGVYPHPWLRWIEALGS